MTRRQPAQPVGGRCRQHFLPPVASEAPGYRSREVMRQCSECRRVCQLGEPIRLFPRKVTGDLPYGIVLVLDSKRRQWIVSPQTVRLVQRRQLAVKHIAGPAIADNMMH